jgi:transposase-like protein
MHQLFFRQYQLLPTFDRKKDSLHIHLQIAYLNCPRCQAKEKNHKKSNRQFWRSAGCRHRDGKQNET